MALRIKRPREANTVNYKNMKKRLIDEEAFAPEETILDDPIRAVYIYRQDGVKYVMKLGNHSSLGDTTKYRLLQNEDNMYKHLSQKLGAEYTKYFPVIINAGDSKDFYYIIMEYIEGVTLSDYVNKSILVPPSIDEVFSILFNLTKALAAMYSTGIVHGDLSAENIMIQENGEVKIIDFEKGSTKNKLYVNTIGSTNLTLASSERNIIQLEKEPEGLGYLFLVIKLLSLVKFPRTLILSMMRKILECEETCKNVYDECTQLIKEFKDTNGSNNDPQARSQAGSPVSDPVTRRRKLRKRKTRKL